MAARKILSRPPQLSAAEAAAEGFELKVWEAANRD